MTLDFLVSGQRHVSARVSFSTPNNLVGRPAPRLNGAEMLSAGPSID